ncbi:MAG: hypothetical protein ACW98X_26410 [Promethearchaeota archaeon]|jgi:hypothetical protein
MVTIQVFRFTVQGSRFKGRKQLRFNGLKTTRHGDRYLIGFVIYFKKHVAINREPWNCEPKYYI